MILEHFSDMMPEILLATMACAILVIDLFLNDRQKVLTFLLVQLSLLSAIALSLPLWGQSHVIMQGHFVSDPLSVLLKISVFVITFALFAYARPYLKAHQSKASEFYLLSLFSVLGMCVLVSAHSLLTLYLGLELLSLPLYALVALQRSYKVASEAAMKYFVMGAVASGMLLFGMSLVYGSSGQIMLNDVAALMLTQQKPDTLLLLGVVFMVIAVAFKFGAVPFHMWLPDVYEGSPNPVVSFIATAPKLAAFGMIFRIVWDLFGSLQADWSSFLLIMAVLSLFLGNIVAIAQSNIKRMLAYSTISHVGFIFLALYTADFAAGLYYMLAYSLMTAGSFGVLVVLSYSGVEVEQINDLAGLDKKHRWLALMMLLLMFSLAGIPPSIGFYAKLTVLMSLVNHGAAPLALFALVISVIGAFYYLRVVRVMYFDAPVNETSVAVPAGVSALLSLNVLSTWILGIFPAALMAICLGIFA